MVHQHRTCHTVPKDIFQCVNYIENEWFLEHTWMWTIVPFLLPFTIWECRFCPVVYEDRYYKQEVVQSSCVKYLPNKASMFSREPCCLSSHTLSNLTDGDTHRGSVIPLKTQPFLYISIPRGCFAKSQAAKQTFSGKRLPIWKWVILKWNLCMLTNYL